MFFYKKNKKLKEEIINLTSSNKEAEEKCEYYHEKYLQIKKDYMNILNKKDSSDSSFLENISQLSSRIILIEISLFELEKQLINSNCDKFLKEIQEVNEELVKISIEITKLNLFLEKYKDYDKNTSIYRMKLEENFKLHQKNKSYSLEDK